MHVIKDTVDFAAYLNKSEGAYIKPPKHWRDEVVDRVAGNQESLGDFLPWSKFANRFRLRSGEVTIWAGINGHGKSLVLGQVVLYLLPFSKAVIASMEMRPAATLHRMLKQASGVTQPASGYVDRFMRWSDGRLWIYDQIDTVKSDRILGMVRYSALELGVKHVVIDSLMKCGIGTDDYNSQKNFVDRLCWTAKECNIHVHLVAHMRKGEHEHRRPGKFDIRGAAEITDMVDNVVIVHRNKKKEEDRYRGIDVDESLPDLTLTVAKQRHGEWESTAKLYFHPDSQQFIPSPGKGAMPWPSPEQPTLKATLIKSQDLR